MGGVRDGGVGGGICTSPSLFGSHVLYSCLWINNVKEGERVDGEWGGGG